MYPNQHPCLFDSQCTSGFCDETKRSCRDTAAGDRCPDNKQCHNGLTCDAKTDRCGITNTPAPTNGKCTSDATCHSSEYCNKRTRRCEALPKENEKCVKVSQGSECARGLTCSGSKCLPACITNADCPKSTPGKEIACNINSLILTTVPNFGRVKAEFGYCSKPTGPSIIFNGVNFGSPYSDAFGSHNPDAIGSPSPNAPPAAETNWVPYLIYSLLGALLFFVLVGVAVFICIKRRNRRSKGVDGAVLSPDAAVSPTTALPPYPSVVTPDTEREVFKLDYKA